MNYLFNTVHIWDETYEMKIFDTIFRTEIF